MISEDVRSLIAQRRSIKPALMEPSREVSEELWQQLFEAANWAPTHGMIEPWRFKVYRGEARELLAKGLQEAYRADTPVEEYRPEKFEKMGKNPLLAHAVVAVVMQPDPKGKVPEIEDVEATACAVQNLHLAASSIGLGVFWSSPAASYGESFAKFLQLEEGDKCLGMLYVGWPKEGLEWPVSKRGAAMEKVHFVG
ncbi:Nitroreductase [Rubritalea squalenifaciens DSM 18772]|uniref:Putative NAD(P)H nitroreductase n=1 Tax=Rubritalea squalenifaciens DSM 18772 TaxID=1123071 RepID=A0A1M6E5X7_9BACT|nr:nitroreductase [Rubritalea squalenifaciens]SHI80916.1 Nitroreductase [Rubritalea squalenifaciens DSM 18772]